MRRSAEILIANVKRLVAEAKITHADLADRMGKKRTQVTQFLSGRFPNPNLETIEEYAKALGTTSARLFQDPEADKSDHPLTECLRRVNAAVEKSQREPSIDEVFSLIEAMVEGSDTDGEGEKLEQLFQDFGQLLGKKKTG